MGGHRRSDHGRRRHRERGLLLGRPGFNPRDSTGRRSLSRQRRAAMSGVPDQVFNLTMATNERPELDQDVAEVRRRVEALANDIRGLGMDLRVSAEEYGPERDFDGTITRTITFSFKIAQQDD